MNTSPMPDAHPSDPDTHPGMWLHPLTHWIVLGFAMLATLLAWAISATSIDRQQKSLFLQQSNQIAQAVEQRMLAYDTVLRGAAEHFRSHNQISSEGWRDYVASLNLQQAYPGIQGIGFSRISFSPARNKTAENEFLASTSVVMLEPDTAMNRQALGFNQFGETTRRSAMLQAMDTGRPVVSGRVRLAVETGEATQHGFLTFFPVYRGSAAKASVVERRAAIRGFVFGVFRVGDLMQGIMGEATSPLHFEIYDGHAATAENFLFDSDSKALVADSDFLSQPLRREIALTIGDRPWLLRIHASNEFIDPLQSALPGAVGAAGLLINLILLVTLKSISRSQRQLAATLHERDAVIAALSGAEADIRTREATLRQLMDSLPASVALIDKQGEILRINRAWSQFASESGASNVLCNDTQGNYLSALRAAAGKSPAANEVFQSFQRLATGEIERFDHEYRCQAPDRARWFQMSVTRMRDAVGNYVVTHTDVSGIREAAERISRYADLTNGSPNAALLMSEHGEVMVANHAAQALLSSDEASLLMQTARQALPAVMAGESVKQTVHAQSTSAAKRQFQLLAAPHREDGQITAVVAVFNDVTELHVAQEQLEVHQAHLEHLVNARTAELLASENRLRMILEATAEGIVCTDTRGVIEFANTAAEELLGHRRQGLVGRAMHETIHRHSDDNEAANACPIGMALAGGADVSGTEDNFWRQDGRRLPVRYAIRKIEAEGEISGLVIAFSSDVERQAADHAREMALDAAKKLAQSKSDFLANMSHEIRTPLNAVIASAMLMEHDETLPRQRERLQRIVGSAKHLLRLINDILDFSKLEAGKVVLDTTEFRLPNIVDGIRNQVIEQLQRKGINWRTEIDSELSGVLRGDPLRLGQVLLNFAANAVKFTEHGEIALSARPVSEIDGEVVVRFEVRDTGCGFDPLKAASLFHSFVQADASVTRQHGGTGLGLAISQQIVELMRGNIGAESTPGKGSCFWFEIPLERGSSTELPSPEASRQLRGKRAILLIVAEPQAARLSERLKALGIAVQRANSAGELELRMETAARIGRAYDFVFCTGEPPGCVEFCQRDIQTRILNPSHGIPPKRVLCLDPSSQLVPDIPDADCFDARIQLDCDTDTFERCLAGLPPGASTLSKPARAAIRRIERLDALKERRLLLVEDNPINQQVAMDMLNSVGLSADIADNGREAIVLTENRRYDLILMDMQMPIMGGIDATSAIRRQAEYAAVPIIALTANASEADRHHCLAAGMNDYLTKPVEPDALYAMLRRWLLPPVSETETRAETTSQPSIRTAETRLLPPGELPQIDGVNCQLGLSRLSGRVNAYRRLLEQLIEMHGRDHELIGQKLHNDDLDAARRLAHALKGSSAMLAAEAISAAALAIEQGIDSSIDANQMQARLDVLETKLDALRRGLS